MPRALDIFNRLAPCIYTGLRTVWRRKDGAPALPIGSLRNVLKDQPKALAAAEKAPGVTCKPGEVDTEAAAVTAAETEPATPKAKRRKRK